MVVLNVLVDYTTLDVRKDKGEVYFVVRRPCAIVEAEFKASGRPSKGAMTPCTQLGARSVDSRLASPARAPHRFR